MTQEPKSRSPRIEIRPELWPALQVEAITRHMSPKDLVNTLILESLHPKAREFMEPEAHDTTTPQHIATKEPMSPHPHDTKCGASPVAYCKGGDADARTALNLILEELEAGREPTVNTIAEKMGLTPTGIGRILSPCGIKAHNTHRENKTVRIYTRAMKGQIEEILSAR